MQVYNLAWKKLEDNKVFLANRGTHLVTIVVNHFKGIQYWGRRSEITRFETHDVTLSMNVMGLVRPQ